MKKQLLGKLLVESGCISQIELDQVIASQKSNEKIGQALKRYGYLTDTQLLGILEYQKNPIQLGKLLLTSGEISQEQLNDALKKQSTTNKKIGEILVESGYIDRKRVESTLSIQKTIITTALLTILSTSLAEATTVQLQWDANTESDLAGYNVYYAPYSSQLIGGKIIDIKSPTTTATVTDLDPYTSYQFAVTAYNTSGQESEFSNIVTIDAQPLPTDTISPTVSITSPPTNIKVKGILTINVNASDNTGISKVEIYNGSVLIYATNTTPYSVNWNTATGQDGIYTLTAKAYDLSGNVSQSTNINVNVYNNPILPANITGIKLVAN